MNAIWKMISATSARARCQIEEHELRHRKNLLVNKAVEKEADDDDLKEGLCQLHKRPLRKDAPESVDRIQFIQLELNGLRTEIQADLEKVDRKADDHDKEHDRERGLGEYNDDTDEDADDILRIDRLVQIAEHIGCVGRDRKIDRVPQELQREEAHEQDKCRIQFLTAPDLSFFPGIGTLFSRSVLPSFPRRRNAGGQRRMRTYCRARTASDIFPYISLNSTSRNKT